MKQQKSCGSGLHIEEGNGDETTRFTEIRPGSRWSQG